MSGMGYGSSRDNRHKFGLAIIYTPNRDQKSPAAAQTTASPRPPAPFSGRHRLQRGHSPNTPPAASTDHGKPHPTYILQLPAQFPTGPALSRYAPAPQLPQP